MSVGRGLWSDDYPREDMYRTKLQGHFFLDITRL